MSSNKGGTLLALLVGAAAGAILGILYAPDKGSNTRDRLSYKLDKYKRMLEDLVQDLISEKEINLSQAKTEGEKVVNDAKEKAEKLLEDVDSLINQIKKGDDIEKETSDNN